MCSLHATFEIPEHAAFSGDAIEAWLAAQRSQPIDSDDLRERLATSSNLLACSENTDMGHYVLALDTETIAATAALADWAGLIVSETTTGWTAIEPMPAFWDEDPGAHVRWTAEVSTYDAGAGDVPALWIVYSTATSSEDVASYQGDNGWTVSVEHTPTSLKIAFSHLEPKDRGLAA
jgi:hypothetical protein